MKNIPVSITSSPLYAPSAMQASLDASHRQTSVCSTNVRKTEVNRAHGVRLHVQAYGAFTAILPNGDRVVIQYKGKNKLRLAVFDGDGVRQKSKVEFEGESIGLSPNTKITKLK